MEKEYSKECSIIAYFIAKYDERALEDLGYNNYYVAFDRIADIFGKKSSFIRNRRDEFDAIVSSRRRGWYQKLPAPGIWSLHIELKMLSFEQLSAKCKEIIDLKKDKNTSEKVSEVVSEPRKKRIKISGTVTREIKIKK